jgi:hypothetical protein
MVTSAQAITTAQKIMQIVTTKALFKGLTPAATEIAAAN